MATPGGRIALLPGDEVSLVEGLTPLLQATAYGEYLLSKVGRVLREGALQASHDAY